MWAMSDLMTVNGAIQPTPPSFWKVTGDIHMQLDGEVT